MTQKTTNNDTNMNNSTYIYLIILIVLGLIYLTRLFIMLLHEELQWYERIGIITLIVFYISLGIIGTISMVKSLELNG